VGFALKVRQRAWAMQRQVAEISWTFDPLVCRNAYFNIAKLAAVAAGYLTNFYGDMRDGINDGNDTDRLLVRWQLATPSVTVAASCTSREVVAEPLLRHGAVVALGRSDHGRPVLGDSAADTMLVAIPADIERLRGSDPAVAQGGA
jgi:predicted GNAT superfamily acetyltransferase